MAARERDEVVDPGLDDLPRPGHHERGADPVEVVGRELRVPECRVEDGHRRPVPGRLRASPAHRRQIGQLPLPDVLTGRFAGGLRVPEHPEQIVAELEGDPGAAARRAEGPRGAFVGPGERRAQREGPFHRVEGALEPGDPQCLGAGSGARHLAVQIEVLPGDHLGAQRPPFGTDPGTYGVRQVGVGDGVIGPGQCEVPGEDGGRAGEVGAAGAPRAGAVLLAQGGVEGGTAPAQR